MRRATPSSIRARERDNNFIRAASAMGHQALITTTGGPQERLRIQTARQVKQPRQARRYPDIQASKDPSTQASLQTRAGITLLGLAVGTVLDCTKSSVPSYHCTTRAQPGEARRRRIPTCPKPPVGLALCFAMPLPPRHSHLRTDQDSGLSHCAMPTLHYTLACP